VDYADVIEKYELREVSREVVSKVMKRIHSFMAECNGMATDGEYLLIRGGNLAYYAGLEYEEPELSGKGWTLYLDGERIEGLISDIEEIEAEKIEAA
jgi:hypothetical protein